MKKLFTFIFLFIISVLIVSCTKDPFIFEISGTTTLEVGQEVKFTHNYDGNERVRWNSSNSDIVAVYNGEVTAISEGVAVISASVENYRAELEVHVEVMNFSAYISGRSSVEIGGQAKYYLITEPKLNDSIIWTSSDESIATISENGNLLGKAEGVVTLTATIKNKEFQMQVQIIKALLPTVRIIGPSQINVGEESKLSTAINRPSTTVDVGLLNYEVSEKGIVTIFGAPYMNWSMKGIKAGTVTIKVYFSKYPEIYDELTVTVIEPQSFNLEEVEYIKAGEYTKLNIQTTLPSNDVEYEISDESIVGIEDGYLYALRPGKVTVKAISKYDSNYTDIITIQVSEYIDNEEISEEDKARIIQILESMTLEQKIGQMFTIGFSGTSYSSTLDSVIKNYHFGNVIYMGANVTDISTLASMSNNIQNAMVAANGIPAFISTDQEGGRVVRLTSGATHFISNMAMAATGNFENTYLQGTKVGEELRNYGINVDFAPVLDVNNNPANPVIGCRSYAENPFIVARYGIGMINGLKDSNVMACVKHFPGHGNTSTDSHYGLPVLNSTLEELYKIELAPFITSIANGVDCIMTTHIIFNAIDSEYPATLSYKVLTELLREELNYDGLIITDGMEMGALKNNFGTAAEVGVQAIKAGADILLYTSNDTPRLVYEALLNEVRNGGISEDRINESVTRILIKKLKYGLLDDYTAPNADISQKLEFNEELNNQFACESLTLMKGEFKKFDKTEKILIISPKCNYQIDASLDVNTLGAYVSKYLNANGYNCNHYTINENASKNQINEIMEKVLEYDRIVIAASNVKTKNYNDTANLVKNLITTKPDTLVIALDTPYDYLKYTNVKNYICVYGYQKASVIAIAKYLNGEYEAKGVSPIDFK